MPTSFAVVITNYNYADFVCEAIDSVLEQTRAAGRIVVVDDGSTDNSAEVLRTRYGDNPLVKLVFSENGGQMVAFARGVAQCEEDVVCFLDADDLWRPNYLEKIGKIYDFRKDVDFLFSDLHQFGKATAIEAFSKSEEYFTYTAIITYLTAQVYGASTSALTMRLEWARRCTDMPPAIMELWRLSADLCVMVAASVFGARKYYLPTGSVRYRVHGENGWYGRRNTPQIRYIAELHKRLTINHCARVIGMEMNCAPLLRLEFAAKIDPSPMERARYERLLEPVKGPPGRG